MISCTGSEDIYYTSGAYASNYDTLEHIGSGAFGCVKLSARRSDGLLVVTKFIRKDRVLEGGWTNDKQYGRIPTEINLLLGLDHPNIIKANVGRVLRLFFVWRSLFTEPAARFLMGTCVELDHHLPRMAQLHTQDSHQVINFFQNDKYFQVIMEKHGSGMDLFEFIDREPDMDEALASYIFRQIVDAVAYLHELNILHRDIKDENILINHKFHCKLIDFGAATFFDPDKLSTRFCGTLEYCSPEILSGHKYRGEEQEMWSLGILLFTLVFFDCPFRSAEQVLKGDFWFPRDVSEGALMLISVMFML
ncbi:unnamed protein product [Soboliphyme baturini]|uniref:Protein kinase domain-containing protein n=1 Tax=Soboliphyme baturini TaxID=241478 RepID=A0A183INY6_9BILA|nr:unnamed protein product [Soboliphyme baturini]